MTLEEQVQEVEQTFPKELLNRPADERIAYFEGFVANHPKIQTIYEELWESIHNQGKYPILYVFGPTGVGKTTLYNKIMGELTEKERANMGKDPGIIPFVGTRAIAAESGIFDWKDFYIRTLEKLKEPLIHKKALLDPKEELKYGAYHNDKSTKAYRKAIENALINRKTSILLIDEAQHLAKMGSGKKLLNQMDVLKSLAAETQTLIILFGTYGLQHFLNLSDQLSRRGKEFHFPRYSYDNEDDLEEFENVLCSFQCQIPLKDEIDLLEYVDFFYERSMGCVGILKDWIDSTFRHALNNGKEQLTIDDFNRTALSLDQCLTIAEEIVNGEKQQGK